jgi:diacylglycerol kinase family enzyme
MVVMLNTHFYGTGAVINPTGKINDGKFEIVIIKPYPWYYIFHMFFAFFTGNIHRSRHVRILSCKKARIKLRPRQDLQVDGEPVGQFRNIETEILHSAINIIYNDQQGHFFLKT